MTNSTAEIVFTTNPIRIVKATGRLSYLDARGIEVRSDYSQEVPVPGIRARVIFRGALDDDDLSAIYGIAVALVESAKSYLIRWKATGRYLSRGPEDAADPGHWRWGSRGNATTFTRAEAEERSRAWSGLTEIVGAQEDDDATLCVIRWNADDSYFLRGDGVYESPAQWGPLAKAARFSRPDAERKTIGWSKGSFAILPDPSPLAPLRDHMAPESFYQAIDAGIRFAVRVLHAAGIETCQACQGGVWPDGKRHAYDRPSIDLPASIDSGEGFRALAALNAYGLRVRDVSIVWTIESGLPCERLWRVTLWQTWDERADEQPGFISSYRAQGGAP